MVIDSFNKFFNREVPQSSALLEKGPLKEIQTIYEDARKSKTLIERMRAEELVRMFRTLQSKKEDKGLDASFVEFIEFLEENIETNETKDNKYVEYAKSFAFDLIEQTPLLKEDEDYTALHRVAPELLVKIFSVTGNIGIVNEAIEVIKKAVGAGGDKVGEFDMNYMFRFLESLSLNTNLPNEGQDYVDYLKAIAILGVQISNLDFMGEIELEKLEKSEGSTINLKNKEVQNTLFAGGDVHPRKQDGYVRAGIGIRNLITRNSKSI